MQCKIFDKYLKNSLLFSSYISLILLSFDSVFDNDIKLELFDSVNSTWLNNLLYILTNNSSKYILLL